MTGLKVEPKSLTKLRSDYHFKLLDTRNVWYLISKTYFKYLYDKSTEDQKLLAERFINSNSVSGLRDWIRKHPSLGLEEMTMLDLRDLAKSLGVRNYCRLTKGQLVTMIRSVKNET